MATIPSRHAQINNIQGKQSHQDISVEHWLSKGGYGLLILVAQCMSCIVLTFHVESSVVIVALVESSTLVAQIHYPITSRNSIYCKGS